ncbi:hypothetical protein DY000_02014625 [Brassica cretica]|uniref:Uncharacterized protein n=1 Tax=Brassica cretica TaxID=69181 RepID=A0ABQ7CQY4_BRACR|nr:hypothetical protein DY000_02014625 [Brassica cretica]
MWCCLCLRSRLLGLSRDTFPLLENQLRVEAGKKVLTSLDLRALEIQLLICVCSSCSRHVSEHLVLMREALLRSGVGVFVYDGFKATLQASSQSSFLFPSGLVPSPESVSTCSCKDFLILGSRRRQPTRVFRVSICRWGLWSLGGLVGESGISQHREQDRFMVVSSHIVFAGLGMLSASTSSGRWSGDIGVLRWYGALFKGRSPGASYSGSDMGVPGIRGNAENLTV